MREVKSSHNSYSKLWTLTVKTICEMLFGKTKKKTFEVSHIENERPEYGNRE